MLHFENLNPRPPARAGVGNRQAENACPQYRHIADCQSKSPCPLWRGFAQTGVRQAGMQDQPAEVTWTDGGVPVSTRFDDPYYSMADGLAETRHVFLAGNGLPQRFRPGFVMAELGFGTGLTLLTALLSWRRAGTDGPLRFVSFEAFPLGPGDMQRALAAFPEVGGAAAEICEQLQNGARNVSLGDLEFSLIVGDARKTIAKWSGRADAWCLDGFSPAKNPELWEPELMAEVAHHTAPGGTFATYTAAGHVRRALSDAGFNVARGPGFGRKRHMSQGILR